MIASMQGPRVGESEDSGVSIEGECGEYGWVNSGSVAPLYRFFWPGWPPNCQYTQGTDRRSG